FIVEDELRAEIKNLEKQLLRYQLGWEPGHFYSPIPALDEIKKNEHKIWKEIPKEIQGINLQEQAQIKLLKQLSAFYKLQPWKDDKQDSLRYYFNNPNYPHGESIILFCLLMHIQPKKVIEIGSGYSSCVILDTNELFFNNAIDTIFIEPYPDLFFSLIKSHDKDNITIISDKLQDADPEVFASLSSGDIVLIDSTHVSKVDSDVNHILFSILPKIAPGVYIHFHDIFYPFEYPKKWIYEGRFWNELYILRAFLQYNNEFEIVLFNSYVGYFFKETLLQQMPLCINPGTSIWLRKKHASE
ncbi:MAG: class I SAM-dependent methyltransferase, partial [Chitinophagaceae bacterium]